MAKLITKFVTLLSMATLVTCNGAADVDKPLSFVFKRGLEEDTWYTTMHLPGQEGSSVVYLHDFEGKPGTCQDKDSLLYKVTDGNCKQTDIRFETSETLLSHASAIGQASVKELQMVLTVRADPDESNCADGSTLQYAQMNSNSYGWTSTITGSIGSEVVKDMVIIAMHLRGLYVPEEFKNEIRQLLNSAIAEGRSTAPLSLNIGNGDSTVTVEFDLMALKATNQLHFHEIPIWFLGFPVLKKYYTVWDSETYRIGICAGKSTPTDTAPTVSEYPQVVQFTLPMYVPLIEMNFLHDAVLEILADTGAEGTAVMKNAFISKRGPEVVHKSNQITTSAFPYYCDHKNDYSTHYLVGKFGPSQEGADMHLMPIKIGEPKCSRCPTNAVIGMGPWTGFLEDDLLYWWTKGFPKIYTFEVKNERSGELSVGLEADPTKCREGTNIDYINVDPLSSKWTIKIEKIEIYNSNGEMNLLDKVELPVIDALVDTGAPPALVLPEAMVESIKAQLSSEPLSSNVTVKVTLRSALDSQSFILQQNFKVKDMPYWLYPARGHAIIGYPLMMSSYMVFNSDKKQIGACPSTHQADLDYIRDLGRWARFTRYLTQTWKKVKKAIGW